MGQEPDDMCPTPGQKGTSASLRARRAGVGRPSAASERMRGDKGKGDDGAAIQPPSSRQDEERPRTWRPKATRSRGMNGKS